MREFTLKTMNSKIQPRNHGNTKYTYLEVMVFIDLCSCALVTKFSSCKTAQSFHCASVAIFQSSPFLEWTLCKLFHLKIFPWNDFPCRSVLSFNASIDQRFIEIFLLRKFTIIM